MTRPVDLCVFAKARERTTTMTNKTFKLIQNSARLIGVTGFILLVASPTGAELGEYGLGGFVLRAAVGLAMMLASGYMMCWLDRRRERTGRRCEK